MIHSLWITLTILTHSPNIYDYKQFASHIINNTQQMTCLDTLWTRESNWNPTANNPTSTAYGIPQILNLKENNPYRQIIIGINYIEHTYKTPCKALNHHNHKGWY